MICSFTKCCWSDQKKGWNRRGTWRRWR